MMIRTYYLSEPLAQVIPQFKKGGEFTSEGGHTISDGMIKSKGITLLAQTGSFNDDIREWRGQSADKRTDSSKNR